MFQKLASLARLAVNLSKADRFDMALLVLISDPAVGGFIAHSTPFVKGVVVFVGAVAIGTPAY
jgi:hypothetical protein